MLQIIRPHDRTVALQRIRDAGAVLCTTESILFDLVRDSTHPKFKEMSKLLQTFNAKGNEFERETIL